MSTNLKSLNQKIWKCQACERCPHPSMPGFFPKDMEVLVIGQNPGQLHKREDGWDDSDYAFNDEYWSSFQKDYARGLMRAPLGKWLNEGFQGNIIWGLTNVVKCRTPDNRVFSELSECRHWTEKQLRILKPKTILSLGALSLSWWDIGISIDRAEGKVFSLNYPFYKGLMMPMYHPAYHDRNYKHDKFSRSFFEKLVLTTKNRKLYTTALALNRIEKGSKIT